MLEEISFPEQEYASIQNYLNKLGYCYTTRLYKEIGKYKEGEVYTAPWGEVLRIDEVKTYRKVSDRPFYDEMTDDAARGPEAPGRKVQCTVFSIGRAAARVVFLSRGPGAP